MAARIVVLFALLAVLCGLSSAQNYCNIKTCRGRPHTACRFQSALPASRCTGLQQTGLTSEEKQKVLNLHNELRQRVARGQEHRGSLGPQPAATNMAHLTWDNELEKIAQTWASQCNFAHDSCRDVERFNVGQNIAYTATTGDISTLDVEQLVKNWYDEVKNYNHNQVARFGAVRGNGGKQIGHYTQLVWADTTKLGCGAIKYKDGKFNKFYLVCNYGPSGNWIGEPVYQTR
ncbi:venom allergen 5-like [Nasonia vitripennis]|uniref:SCP domain-containing protein n=1 Tax=Nasonia vitripennis TaxID=7425 RepID=A0A7M7G4W9_NASVI|nr:venom allergen 5-like [Nasonia vitripennis]